MVAAEGTFGGGIAARRVAAGLTQSELAAKAKISQSTVSRVERSEEPTIKVLRAAKQIARALGTSVDEFADQSTLEALEVEFRADIEFEYDEDYGGNTFCAYCPSSICPDNTYTHETDKKGASFKFDSFYTYDAREYDSVNFCGACGKELVKDCPGCGEPLSRSKRAHRFCRKCGTSAVRALSDEEWQKLAHEPPF